ncbi:helix-turn-helix transcriptional regulator [Schumannella soli]|uniref:Helix-turn-helix domain-containing protein n=1 Tax=Schumannella soli TaxID=2590779 RepID=A0A506XYU1_9MICO|nr:helix-turn-helix transcriptional regulator [Schumannella soli]TPW77931.1 helix-turn-helix domain-containing protein [Schumannella soli]
MDRIQLADFLRSRREALQPEDVGLPRGPRRRTGGLRREEIAQLCGMSTDYWSRLEQQRGPQPSEQMLGAIARGLHLSVDERAHLFRLAGHAAPEAARAWDHVSPGVQRILDRLGDTPAMVLNDLGETLVQTPLARALLGDHSGYTGLSKVNVYRWYADPATRDVYPRDDQPEHGAVFTAELRSAYSTPATRARATAVVDALLASSPEFAEVWARHDVRLKHPRHKRFAHPEVGELELDCQTLVDPESGQTLLVFTATPGSPSAEKLALLAVIGARSFA